MKKIERKKLRLLSRIDVSGQLCDQASLVYSQGYAFQTSLL